MTKQGKAKHKALGEIVSYKEKKDRLGYSEVGVKFANGETTTMTEKRFEELFEKVSR